MLQPAIFNNYGRRAGGAWVHRIFKLLNATHREQNAQDVKARDDLRFMPVLLLKIGDGLGPSKKRRLPVP